MKNIISIITLFFLAFVLVLLASSPTELTYDVAEKINSRQIEFASARNPAWETGIMEKPIEAYPNTHSPTEVIIKWGDFIPKRRSIQGRAVMYRDKKDLYISVEYFETNHYGDLWLYLIPVENTNSAAKVMDAFYEVGRINSIGDQFFDLPDDLNTSRYKAAVIFSPRQNQIYGLASLN